MQSNPDFQSYCHYLPITDDLLHCGFYVTSAGKSKILPGAQYPLERHPSLYTLNWERGRILPEFSLILVTNGIGIFETRRLGPISVKSGSIIQVFPGIWHRYQPNPNTGWTEKWIQFSGEFAHKLFEDRLISPDRPVQNMDDFRSVEGAIDRLLANVHCNFSSNSVHTSRMALEVIAAVIGRTLPSLPKSSSTSFGEKPDPIVASALDFIWARSHWTLSVTDVAEAVHISRRKLERHMMANRGHTVLHEIIQCRFSRAERLLRETDLPIKNIISLAGFGSVQNMRYVFLSKAGYSPGDYRVRYRQNSNQIVNASFKT